MSYGRGIVGSRCEMTEGFNKTELAKFVRADIKACQKKGQLPKDMKVSVRTRYYSGGGSIDVTVTAAGFKLCLDSYLHAAAGGHYSSSDHDNGYFTVQAEATKRKLNAILQAYNYDDSEPQVDHFNVRFYGHAEISHYLVSAEVEAYKAAMTPGMALPEYFDFLAHREAVEAASVLPENYGDVKGLKAMVAAKALGAEKPAPKPISQAVADVVATIEKRQAEAGRITLAGWATGPNPRIVCTYREGFSEYELQMEAAGWV